MPEAHQPPLARLDPRDERGHVRDRPDLRQHPQHRLVGAAVQRAVERRRRSGERDVRVGVRAADAAHGRRAAVLFVVGVQDEQDVECALEHRVARVLRLGALEQHVEEVAGVRQLVVGQHVRQSQVMPVSVGRDGRHLADEPQNLEAPGRFVLHLLGVGVERRERADRTQEDAHRVRVVAKALHQLLDVLVHHRVHHDIRRPRGRLTRRRQFAAEEEPRHFEKRRALGELFDRVAAIAQDAAIAIGIR